MKNSISYLLAFLLLISNVAAQDIISIVGKSPYPPNVKVYFEGYEGFSKTDLGYIRSSATGEVDYFVSYNGFCIMKADGHPAYPLILEYDPVCLEWSNPPNFPCDPENEYYYKMLPQFLSLDSAYANLKYATDSLEKVNFRQTLESKFTDVEGVLSSGPSLHAKTFLEAELLIHRCRIVNDGGLMAQRKENIHGIIELHYEAFYPSNILMKLAEAYLEMNYAVFENRESLKQAMLYDVDTWVKMLGPMMGEKEVVDFFLIHFVKKEELGIAADLVANYADLVKCEQFVGGKRRPATMPYSFSVFGGPDLSKVYNLDQFYGISKILAVYSTECPASVAAVAGLYAFMAEKQIRLPVILSPGNEPEGELADLISKKAPFGLQLGVKTGSAVAQGAGVKQLPAFLFLDEKNLLKEIIYDMNELKTTLAGDAD